jgi:hypothetical protein
MYTKDYKERERESTEASASFSFTYGTEICNSTKQNRGWGVEIRACIQKFPD